MSIWRILVDWLTHLLWTALCPESFLWKAFYAGLGAGTVIIVAVAIVRWKEVITWFRERQNLKDED